MIGRKRAKWVLAALVILACATAASWATAQKKKGAGGVIRLEETVIEGRVAKPNAFFINTRSDIVYDQLELKESFVGEIGKVVADGDF